MDRSSAALRIGLAQIDSRLGEVEENVAKHLDWIHRARERGVDLLLFPELSLTGYRLLHLTAHVAMDPHQSHHMAALTAAAGDMSVVVGLVEEDEQGTLYNAAVLVAEGAIQHVHRKHYLPTYGLFQEGRFFAEGADIRPGRWRGHELGLLVCEDLWHPPVARHLARSGAHMLAVLSASPGRIGPGPRPESQEDWELLTRSTALLDTAWVFYCNRVGWEEGSFYTGGSHVVRPGGEIVARAPLLDEDLLIVDIDLGDSRRLRRRLPLLRSERLPPRGAAGKDISG